MVSLGRYEWEWRDCIQRDVFSALWTSEVPIAHLIAVAGPNLMFVVSLCHAEKVSGAFRLVVGGHARFGEYYRCSMHVGGRVC